MSVVVKVGDTVPKAKVAEFFAFCGAIQSIEELSENGRQFRIEFVLHKAVSTAVLLDGAELDSSPISVTEETPPPYTEESEPPEDNKVQQNDTLTGDESYDGILQEEKPKVAILAQLLAKGYTFSDALIQKGVDFDKEKGYSALLKLFVSGVDKKYIGVQDPNSYA